MVELNGLLQLLLYVECSAIPYETYSGPWSWMKTDAFEEYMIEFNSVTKENCRFKRGYWMQGDTISRVPSFNGFLYVGSFLSLALKWILLHSSIFLNWESCTLKSVLEIRNIHSFWRFFLRKYILRKIYPSKPYDSFWKWNPKVKIRELAKLWALVHWQPIKIP